MEEPFTLNIAVYDVPDDGEEHNDNRHLSFSLEQEREDKRALEVMELEDKEEYPIRRLAGNGIG